jgi:membrane dipeptidase
MSASNVRNKPDALLRAVAEKGGIVGIFDLFYLARSPRQPNLDDYIAHMTHALNVCEEIGIGSDTTFDATVLSDEERAAWGAETERRRR